MSFLNRSAGRLLLSSSNKVNGLFQQNVIPTAGLLNPINSSSSVRTLNRSLVVLSTPNKPPVLQAMNPSTLCACGCGVNGMHTRGDRELIEFLQDEIVAEKKNQSSVKIPTSLGDYSIKGDGGELVLSKSFSDEQITITLSVNHTVESESPAHEGEEVKEGGEEDVMKSKPDFEVDVKIGNKTMAFSCQFTPPMDVTEAQEGEAEDTFAINELSFFEGEHSDKTYAVSGELLDGMFYDLLMNYLEERGVNVDFVDKLSNICTQYEHSQYIGLLENIQTFVKRK